MIRLQRISTADGFLYEYMEQLITAAFPPEEHRPLEELRLYTDSRPHFYNNIISVSYTHLTLPTNSLV